MLILRWEKMEIERKLVETRQWIIANTHKEKMMSITVWILWWITIWWPYEEMQFIKNNHNFFFFIIHPRNGQINTITLCHITFKIMSNLRYPKYDQLFSPNLCLFRFLVCRLFCSSTVRCSVDSSDGMKKSKAVFHSPKYESYSMTTAIKSPFIAMDNCTKAIPTAWLLGGEKSNPRIHISNCRWGSGIDHLNTGILNAGQVLFDPLDCVGINTLQSQWERQEVRRTR